MLLLLRSFCKCVLYHQTRHSPGGFWTCFYDGLSFPKGNRFLAFYEKEKLRWVIKLKLYWSLREHYLHLFSNNNDHFFKAFWVFMFVWPEPFQDWFSRSGGQSVDSYCKTPVRKPPLSTHILKWTKVIYFVQGICNNMSSQENCPLSWKILNLS